MAAADGPPPRSTALVALLDAVMGLSDRCQRQDSSWLLSPCVGEVLDALADYRSWSAGREVSSAAKVGVVLEYVHECLGRAYHRRSERQSVKCLSPAEAAEAAAACGDRPDQWLQLGQHLPEGVAALAVATDGADLLLCRADAGAPLTGVRVRGAGARLDRVAVKMTADVQAVADHHRARPAAACSADWRLQQRGLDERVQGRCAKLGQVAGTWLGVFAGAPRGGAAATRAAAAADLLEDPSMAEVLHVVAAAARRVETRRGALEALRDLTHGRDISHCLEQVLGVLFGDEEVRPDWLLLLPAKGLRSLPWESAAATSWPTSRVLSVQALAGGVFADRRVCGGKYVVNACGTLPKSVGQFQWMRERGLQGIDGPTDDEALQDALATDGVLLFVGHGDAERFIRPAGAVRATCILLGCSSAQSPAVELLLEAGAPAVVAMLLPVTATEMKALAQALLPLWLEECGGKLSALAGCVRAAAAFAGRTAVATAAAVLFGGPFVAERRVAGPGESAAESESIAKGVAEPE